MSLENFNSDLFSADFSNSDESGSSQDESDSVDREEVLPPIHHPVTEKPQRSRPRADRSETAWPIGRCHSDPQLSGDTEFLKSLSPLIPEYRRHPDANVYLQQFKKNRLGLVDRLYLIYNRKVFDTKVS